MRARLYMRVSTDEQARTGFSLAAQEEKLRAFCVSQDWRVAGLYTDDGASAKNLDRPQFQRMLKEAEANDVIVAYKLDRLTRSVRDLDDLLRLFEHRNLHLRSATEQFDTTTATGRLFIRMVAEFAQWERETIAERAAMGKTKRVRSGEWGGGPASFGYRAVPSEQTKAGRVLKCLEPDPTCAHIVREIFERYVGGHGTRAIAVWLNDERQVRSAAGRRFSSTAVSVILKNPLYCGYVSRNKRTETIMSTHPPLIEESLFREVQRTFERRARYAPRHATGNYPLTGVARCGSCGATVTAGYNRHGKVAQKRVDTYRCSHYVKGLGCGPVPLTGIPAALAEFLLLEEIARLESSDAYDAFVATCMKEYAAKTGSTRADIDRLKGELQDAKVAVAQWDARFERQRMTLEDHDEKTRPHLDRIKAIGARLAELEAALPVIPKLGEVRNTLAHLRDAWPELTPPERKAAVQFFVEAIPVAIYLHPDRRVELRPRVL